MLSVKIIIFKRNYISLGAIYPPVPHNLLKGRDHLIMAILTILTMAPQINTKK
jgi:hypothetical protein